MPDPELSSTLPVATRAKEYRNEPHPATPSLQTRIRENIRNGGAMAFADFMEIALYDPEHGYYAGEPRQVGRGGDFFTSVSVGSLFGKLLARRFLRWHREAGVTGRWRILECGAHDGTLASDILGEIATLDPTAFFELEYAISEPLPRLRRAQQETLAGFLDKVRHEIQDDPLPGIVFGNELLDALPFHVVQREDGAWAECLVGLSPDEELCWELRQPIRNPALQAALAVIGEDFPDGYRTEVRTSFGDFLQSTARCLKHGLMIWVDYGFAREDYYHPHRIEGTLRTFSKHRAAENPLETPGEIDITAHVDFTAVIEAAIKLGGEIGCFRSQGQWLVELAREWLLEQEGIADPAAIRQFQTLTHPAHLGARFNVLELIWNDISHLTNNNI